MSTGGSSVPRIQVFRPTMEEFKNFSKYIEKIESLGAHKAGLAKIIPPDGWCPRKKGYDDINLTIPSPISQMVTGRQGLYQQYNIQKRAMTVKEFKKLAEGTKYRTPPHFDYEDLERKYWKNITYNSPIYGADVSGSLYDDGIEEFNIQHLNTILDLVKQDYAIQIEGVNTAYLYFGMWKTTFAWHTEDMDLYSINYLHFGAPKSWYVIPPEHGRRLERLAANFFHGSLSSCPAFLRHKMTIISPQILKQYSIPFNKITQEPGEFMITFPFGYHSGFNHGYNCAESTNFALPRWVEYGKRAISCTCRNDCVKICMDMFVRKYQPERYELWKAGKDFGNHPEDPSRHYAAPTPNKLELAIAAQREKRKPKQSNSSQKLKRHPISQDLLKGKDKCEMDSFTKEDKDDCESTDSKNTEIYDIDEDIDSVKLGNVEAKQDTKATSRDSTDKETGNVHLNGVQLKNNDSDISMVVDEGEDLKVPFSDVIEEPVIDEIEIIKSKSEEPIKKKPLSESKSEHPPDLKPFWGEERFENKVHGELRMKSHISHDLFAEFPGLRQAIKSGDLALSIKGVPFEEGITVPLSSNKTTTVICPPPHQTSPFMLSGNSTVQYTTISSDMGHWKCEHTQGLKVKFVQPKLVGGTSPLLGATSSAPTKRKASGSDHTYGLKPNLVSPDTGTKEKETTASKSKDHKKHKRDRNFKSSKSVKAASESLGNWAQPILDLWQHRPFNFDEECKFNTHCSSVDPHCAICMVFTPPNLGSDYPNLSGQVPPSSKVKMPSFCFGDGLDNQCILDSNPLLSRDGSSPLLVCSKCRVCVHATCYGITMLEMGDWICSRCSSDKAEHVECCLCVLRGGALKPTHDGRWTHVLCAILIPETNFENVIFKEPVNISKVDEKRQRLKCRYCFKSSQSNIKGACIQCLSGKCYLSFHVTCGLMAGVMFEANDWPEPINIVCTRHSGGRRKPLKRNFTAVNVGDTVLAKHKKNRRFYWVKVKQKYMQEYYSVLFEDNSTSTNTLPEDIIYRATTVSGCPEINEKIRVKWTDGKVYKAIFKGSRACEIFVIEFDDGSVFTQERYQIYAQNETLPKDVMTKMSHSSDRQHLFKGEIEGKRTRVSSVKYYDD